MNNSSLPELYFATHNQHKTEEVRAMLSGLYEVKNLHDLAFKEEIPETGSTLEENSRIKAEYLSTTSNVNCFADDSGLEVDCLDGAPGVFSARYAGEPKSDDRNIDLLLENMTGASNRKARFRSVITLILQGTEKQFEGIVNGKIISTKQGSGGFGYDPVFIPEGYDITFAEMDPIEKNRISHRGIAVQRLIEYLRNSYTK